MNDVITALQNASAEDSAWSNRASRLFRTASRTVSMSQTMTNDREERDFKKQAGLSCNKHTWTKDFWHSFVFLRTIAHAAPWKKQPFLRLFFSCLLDWCAPTLPFCVPMLVSLGFFLFHLLFSFCVFATVLGVFCVHWCLYWIANRSACLPAEFKFLVDGFEDGTRLGKIDGSLVGATNRSDVGVDVGSEDGKVEGTSLGDSEVNQYLLRSCLDS